MLNFNRLSGDFTHITAGAAVQDVEDHTGDADIAIEGTTLYMFTERPVGVAFRELDELFDSEGLSVQGLIEVDENGDGSADDSTGWHNLKFGQDIHLFTKSLSGIYFRIFFILSSKDPRESPLIEKFKLTYATAK